MKVVLTKTEGYKHFGLLDDLEIPGLELVPLNDRWAIVAYVKEAAANEQAGKQYAYKPTTDFAMAEEFLVQLEEMPGLREAFEALTPGRQRGYLLRFSGAKKSETRVWVDLLRQDKWLRLVRVSGFKKTPPSQNAHRRRDAC